MLEHPPSLHLPKKGQVPVRVTTDLAQRPTVVYLRSRRLPIEAINEQWLVWGEVGQVIEARCFLVQLLDGQQLLLR